MEEKSSYKKGFNYSIRLLSQRDYSIYKMRKKLSERQFETTEINKIIEKLLSYNYIREAEYTKMQIKKLIVKGHSNSYILQKLEQEFLIAQVCDIEKTRSEQDLSSEKQMTYLIEKKLRFKDLPEDFESKLKLKKKITSFLISKGYQYDEICIPLSRYL